MRRSIISLVLCVAMVFQFLPAQAAAADGIEITEIRFYSSSGSSDYVLLSDAEGAVEVDYTEGAYRFEIGFNSPAAVSHVYILATADGVSKALDAEYDSQTGRFVTEGYFDSSDTDWAPESLEFLYARKSTAPKVGSSVNWEQIRSNLSSEMSNAVVTETTEGNTTIGSVDMSATVDTMKDLDLSYCIKALDSATGSDLETLRGYYQTGLNVAAYVLPGVDDSRYYAYIDYSDPNSVKVFVDDGMDITGTAIEIALEFMDSSSGTAQSLQSVSQALGEAAPIADLLMDSYIIHHDMDQLRAEIDNSSHIPDKVTAKEAVDALEADKIVFNVMAYMLPIIATGGAAGPAAVLFTGMVGVMSKAAEWVYEQRIGGITGETVRTEQISQDGLVYWGPDHADRYHEYDPGSCTIRITKNPRGTDSWDTEAMKQGYNVWMELYHEFIRDTRSVVYDSGISEQNIQLPPNVSEIVFNNTGDISVWGGDKSTDMGGLSSLWRIEVPEGVTSFGFNVNDCIALQTISLPDTITHLVGPGETPRPLILINYAGNMSQWDEIENSGYYEAVYTIHMTPAGWHGDNVDWVYDTETQTLTFTGQGAMAEIGLWDRWVDGTTERCYYYPWFRVSDDVKRIVVGEGITSISRIAFANLPALEEVVLPSTLTSIGEAAFQNCSALKTVVMEEGITEIPKYCFDGCTSLETISLPEGPETIGDYAFRGSGLKSIEIPFGVTSVRSDCFKNCTALTTVTIPYTVKSVNALQRCSALSKVYYGSSKTAWEKIGGKNITADVEFTPEGLCEDGLAWHLDEETGVLTISGTGEMRDYGEWTFSEWTWPNWYDYRDQIRQVVVEEGITVIGQMAFGANFNEEIYHPGEKLDYPLLTEVSLPGSLECIRDYAFNRCSVLKSIRIPESVLYINSYVFADLPKLDQIWFQGDAPQIDSSSFENVSGTAYYPADNATWTEETVQSYQNRYNSELLWQPICKGGCKLVVTKGTEATCTQPGYSEGKHCSVCGVIQQTQTVIPATGHSFGEWYVVSEVEQRRDCSICSDRDVKLIHDAADMNQDGVVTSEDALLILWNVMDEEAYPLAKNGDINGDGSVNDGDAQYLIWFTLFPSVFKMP